MRVAAIVVVCVDGIMSTSSTVVHLYPFPFLDFFVSFFSFRDAKKKKEESTSQKFEC